MRRLTVFLVAAQLAIFLICGFAACATTPTTQEQFVQSMTRATQMVDQVVLAADTAVNAGVLKGADARSTLLAVQAARDGLNAAKLMSDPTQGLNKVTVTLALLAATQTYLATLGATK